MVHMAPWKAFLVIAICIAGFFTALPNVLPNDVRKAVQGTGFLPSQPLNLGLDLRGGVYLLLEVKVDPVITDRLKGRLPGLRSEFRKKGVRFTELNVKGDTLSVFIPDEADRVDAKTVLDSLSSSITSMVALGFNTKDLEVTEDQGRFTVKYTEPAMVDLRKQVIEQSIEVVRRRVDGGGVKEAAIQRQGANRILVQVPGLEDPQQLKTLLGKTAKMTFHLVDDSVSASDVAANRVPPGTTLLYEQPRNPGEQPIPVVIRDTVIISGDMLVRAAGGYDQQSGQPIVSFAFNMQGAREFARVTRENVGKRFAIVLDKDVISAPVIRTPILGGDGQIEGGFTNKTANDLAVMLNAGALPAEISVVEERVVGAELGADSVAAGQVAAIVGLCLVVVFMALSYGLFGVFANVALLCNLVLLAGLFTIFQITLTLPGIAAFVLTMGMAVDANVLIFERIREERALGKGVIASIDSGFERAMTTIIDSQLTTLLAGLILIAQATGPVRGFGVALSLGIVTSVFTAIWVTRLCVVQWLKTSPKEIAL